MDLCSELWIVAEFTERLFKKPEEWKWEDKIEHEGSEEEKEEYRFDAHDWIIKLRKEI